MEVVSLLKYYIHALFLCSFQLNLNNITTYKMNNLYHLEPLASFETRWLIISPENHT